MVDMRHNGDRNAVLACLKQPPVNDLLSVRRRPNGDVHPRHHRLDRVNRRSRQPCRP